MAQQNKMNPIKFWCLKEHLTHYKKVYADKKIEVHAIDELLEEKFDGPHADKFSFGIDKFKKIHATCIMDTSRNQLRDRVTVKNAFSLLLLLTKGGYIADTNIKPASDKEVFLPHHEKFRCPLLTNVEGTDKGSTEIWMMYSPPENCEVIYSIYKYYYSAWQSAEDYYFKDKSNLDVKNKGYPKAFHDEMGLIVLQAIEGTISQYKKEDYWCGELDDTSNPQRVILEDINILKLYYRTHTKQESLIEQQVQNVYSLFWSNRFEDEPDDDPTNSHKNNQP
jgi:hypothetical protein